MDEDRIFTVQTTQDGIFRGTPIRFLCSNRLERDQWVGSIVQVLFEHANQDPSVMPTGITEGLGWDISWRWRHFRMVVRSYYLMPLTALIIVGLILANFLLSILQAQLPPGKTDLAFDMLDNAFTCIFSVELVVNLIATWPNEFLADAWNYFDTLTVCVSVATLILPESILPPESSITLKIFRTFRVFRIIKRVSAVRRIVAALVGALPAMGNAFTIVFVLTSLYSILAVRFFSQDKEQGAEYFGSFFACLFTFWQIMSGDDWSVVVRSLMATQTSSTRSVMVACFFSSYQLLISICLINVVVCVLVDSFDIAADVCTVVH
jgi:voltage-gated sodium channel